MGIRSYREQRRLFYILMGGLMSAAFVSGLVVGIILPRQTTPSLTLREMVDTVIEKAEDIKAALDLVALEYSQGGLEAGAAKGHLDRAMVMFQEIRGDLEVLNRTGTEMLSTKLLELEEALGRGETPERVTELVAKAQDILDDILEPYRVGGQ